MQVDTVLLNKVIDIARAASEQILTIYNRIDEPRIVVKDDNSPLTQADLASHRYIEQALIKLTPDIPILSEESPLPEFELRQSWSIYWLIDPLDGTKEFISRNGEFTVNIALIEHGVPVLGVVHVPIDNISYAGFSSTDSRFACKMLENNQIEITARSAQSQLGAGLPIEVVASRHHRAEAVDALCGKVNSLWGDTHLRPMGSSLKICLVAEGQADFYPRFGPTSEWDTAAAQAVVEAAGGHLLTAQGLPLRYNQKSSILNPEFFVIGLDIDRWRAFLQA